MKNIEELLNMEKERIEDIKVPIDMEDRLREALDVIPKKKGRFKVKVASILIAILLLGYNADTLAYYGKRLIGYESIMNGTLRELNELGKGQIIDKAYTFKNGLKLTLDGIMIDDNNMVVFYTIYSPDGKVDDTNDGDTMGIVYVMGAENKVFTGGGAGEINEDGTEMKWVITTHEAPKFFEKNLKLTMDYTYENGEVEKGEIPFKIDRSQAVGKSIKMNIDKKIKLGNRNIKVESLTASPISTVVKGKLQNILELGLDTISKNRIRPENIEMALIADGKIVDVQSSGMSTDMNGTRFDIRFDRLPEDTKNLQLRLISLGADFDAKEEIDLIKGESRDVQVLEQIVSIDDVYEEDGNTYIVITTEEDTLLSRVNLNIDGEVVPLERTISSNFGEGFYKDKNSINYTRTLEFKGSGEKLTLEIERIRYNKSYDEVIYEYSLE
ncbi:DUF4179 domain-containing protein [Tissierellaceae bacterium HCP3S3_D8]